MLKAISAKMRTRFNEHEYFEEIARSSNMVLYLCNFSSMVSVCIEICTGYYNYSPSLVYPRASKHILEL